MRYCLFIIICFSCILLSCGHSEEKKHSNTNTIATPQDAMSSLSWVLGSWSNISEETQSYERWEIENDSLWVGMSITLKDGDTIFAERMRIFKNKGIIGLYVETLGDQPNPVVFTQVPNAAHPFTFENQENEFPSQIIYTQTTKNKLHAWVSGIIEGAPQRIDFYFTKD